jgi:glucose-1-phosphate adenylyltransferase
MIHEGARVFAYPYSGYWVDVGTVASYWQAHMDMLADTPALDLNNRTWIIHTRTEERPPAFIGRGAHVEDSMIADGCILAAGSQVIHSILSPGVQVSTGAVIRDSIVLTDSVIKDGAIVERAILDKRVIIGKNCRIGSLAEGGEPIITMVGKSSIVPPEMVLDAGSAVGPDVVPTDFPEMCVHAGQYIQTQRMPNEV